jgi:hypothetical protein
MNGRPVGPQERFDVATISRPAGAGLEERMDRWSEKPVILVCDHVRISAEHPFNVPRTRWWITSVSVGMLMGRQRFILGK